MAHFPTVQTTLPVHPLRFLVIAGWAAFTGILSTLAAYLLQIMIAALTQLAFYGKFSIEWVSPENHHLGFWVILIPAAGAGVIALMARFGSKMIIGHGIPEAMQQVLVNRSRIAPKVAVLKPLSSVISIGSGGPYGAEGPAIATGSALGSTIGQLITTSAAERKTLLAAGAAAAMTAIFGCPVAATLLAIELLLFEFRPRSFIPVAIAASSAQALRFAMGAPAALFHFARPAEWSAPAGAFPTFVAIGIAAGVLAVVADMIVHKTEEAFSKLPISWVWYPVIGGLGVGVIGLIEPRIFGSSYNVIGALLEGNWDLSVIALVCGLKFLAWVVSLGSGTSGGTLAPMLIAGGGLGALVAALCAQLPIIPVSPQLAALVGMIAFFAGASRALFGSILLGVEITQQAGALWPLATTATVALTVAYIWSKTSIMTSPIELRGIRVPMEFDTDAMARVTVGQVMDTPPSMIAADAKIGELADRIGANDPELSRHQALLIEGDAHRLAGVITRRDILKAVADGHSAKAVRECMSTSVICAWPDELLSDAIERCQMHDIGRLPVVSREDSTKLVGYLGRTAMLSARQAWARENAQPEPGWLEQRWSKYRAARK